MVDTSIVILKSAGPLGPEYRIAEVEHTDMLYIGIDDDGHWIPNSEYIHKCFDESVPFDTFREAVITNEIRFVNGLPILSIDIWSNMSYNSL